jgi:CheY-like chemotaxis protein
VKPPPKFTRVFLVEDNEADECLVTGMLRDFGGGQFILCGVFARLAEAIEALENLGNVDVVLLDLSLPDSQGQETFLRLMQAVPDQPVIVLSGQGDEAFAIETVRLGAQDYLTKSDLTGRLLVRSIRYSMERKRTELASRTAREEQGLAERSQALAEANRRLAGVLEQLKTAQGLAIQQERLLAMERMSGGIAHDFNNALSPILAHSEWLLRKPGALGDEAAVRKALENIHASAGHCAEVVLRLRNFCLSRDEFAPFVPLDVREVVQAALLLTQPSWKDQAQMRGCNISVETDFGSVPKIRGAREDLIEMFADILLHIVEVMVADGVLSVRIAGGPEGVSVCLSDHSVSVGGQTGGCSPEPSEGKGISLGVIYGIAQSHGAEIHVGGWDEVGMQVTVLFPVPEAFLEETAETEQPKPTAPAASLPTKGLRILAVEDDANIREILGIYLKEEGHSVELAAEGAEALTKFEKDHFDLLLTDYSMPNMNGDRLAAAVRAADPKIRIALLTGFGSQLPQGAPLRLEVDAIISKPFTFETLRQGIAEAMGG